MGYIFDAMQRADDEPAKPASPPVPGDPLVLPFAADRGPALEAEDSDEPVSPLYASAAASLAAAPEPDPRDPDDEPSPVLADLSQVRRREDGRHMDDRLVAIHEPSSVMAEEYRSIRTGILARWNHKSHLVHTITSATPQEGKTLTSLNLGLIFAELRNRRTIVIEADLRLPQFKKLLDLPESPGLVGLLEGECKLGDVVHEVGDRNLHVIPAGRRVSNEAVQILSGREMASLITQLKQKYDHVIIDTPPVVELADAGILGAMSDDVLLIVRMNRTPHPLIERAIRTLASYNAPVAGLIATDQQRHDRRSFYRYGYSSRYQYGAYAKAA